LLTRPVRSLRRAMARFVQRLASAGRARYAAGMDFDRSDRASSGPLVAGLLLAILVMGLAAFVAIEHRRGAREEEAAMRTYQMAVVRLAGLHDEVAALEAMELECYYPVPGSREAETDAGARARLEAARSELAAAE